MAKVRLAASEPRIVPWLGSAIVQPDQVVEIPDDQFDAYVCQPAVWEAVEEPRSAKKPSTTSSAKSAPTQKDGD